MITNLATAIPTGTAITMFLLYAMNMLIDVQPNALVEAREPHFLKWVRVPRNEDRLDTIEPPIQRIVDPPIPPESSAPVENAETTISVALPPVPAPGHRVPGPVSFMSDGPLVAIVRVQPTYPARPRDQGLEGYVIVQFDVLADGTVSNVTVVESSSRLFETAATRAALRFRFKPRVVDGVALPTSGVQNLFRFEMEN